MNNISFFNVDIDGGFWQKQQELNRKVTVHAVYERFFNSGRFSALNCNWKDGDPLKPHIFWDSDVAKWLEGAAYIIKKTPDEKLEEDIEKIIADYNLPILTTTGTARKADENLYRTTALPREEVRVRMIPYFSWANRARTDMTVWLLSD